jgi:hypothetical protein
MSKYIKFVTLATTNLSSLQSCHKILDEVCALKHISRLNNWGRAIGLPVSHQHTNTAARVQAWVLGQGSSEYFGFHCQAFHHLLHSNNHSSSTDGTIDHLESSGIVDYVPLHPKKQENDLTTDSVKMISVICAYITADNWIHVYVYVRGGPSVI